ncbi:hypothetical protein RE6C_02544 [Rhodopirellula europaea 6C]|uniref:Uncharacterized protein n=1 Tax=Rhodopirellula europaea 6C TaxID=1263867 RepID=M2B3E0_9BACT|nr:hypothetical protein RE6C_02544 [Rhodopirellula europaea 6C]
MATWFPPDGQNNKRHLRIRAAPKSLAGNSSYSLNRQQCQQSVET